MTLDNLYKIFSNHKEGQWVMQWHNAILLYRFIKNHPVKRILDLGTGIGVSTAICALALQDKGETDYHIDTVEQFDKCVNLAKELIPKELQEHITIHKSNTKVWSYDKIPYQFFSNYETLPEGEWGLIINDGPSFWRDGDKLIDLPNGTVTEMLLQDKIKPGTFVAWDGRQSMLSILERFFGSEERTESAFELYRPNQQGDDLNILRRLDNPVVCRDYKLKIMKEQSTFFNEEKTTFSPTDGTPPQGADETPVSGTEQTI